MSSLTLRANLGSAGIDRGSRRGVKERAMREEVMFRFQRIDRLLEVFEELRCAS